MYWKFEKPQNAPHKLMSNEMGYEALISAVKDDKKSDSVVMIFMPPPVKDLVSVYFSSSVSYLLFRTQAIWIKLMTPSSTTKNWLIKILKAFHAKIRW
jgi:hypothetical protein